MFESSVSKCTHLLASPSPLGFKLATFKDWHTYLLSVDNWPKIFGGKDADGLSQGAGAEFSGYSAIPGHSANIKREPHLYCSVKRGVNINGDPPGTKIQHFFSEGCCNSANLTSVSVWQTASRNFHTPLVRSLADRTKVITMGAPQKLIGLQTLFLSTFSRSSSGFSAFRSWKSTEHRATAFLHRSSLKSVLIDLAALAALACRRFNFCGNEG